MSKPLKFEFIIYIIVQAAMFSLGITLVLASALSASALQLLPLIVAVSAILSPPVASMIASPLHLRFQTAMARRSIPAKRFTAAQFPPNGIWADEIDASS
jgi:hypothetical protein